MNWKNRLTNYNFWISIFSAVLLILQALKIEFDIAYVNEIFTAVLGLLVVIGIISDPTRTTMKSGEQKKEETSNTQIKETKPENQIEEVNLTPTKQEDEIDNDFNQNSLQIVLEEISKKINEKFKDFENFKTTPKENDKSETISEVCETKQNQTLLSIEDQEEIKPAAAETNPYIDVIN